MNYFVSCNEAPSFPFVNWLLIRLLERAQSSTFVVYQFNCSLDIVRNSEDEGVYNSLNPEFTHLT